MEISDDSSANSEIDEVETTVCGSLLPEKSKKRYEMTYDVFKKWCASKAVTNLGEDVLLTYFYERSERLKSSSSLWCVYSMLKTVISTKDNIDISKYEKLKDFLKRKNIGYRPRKSRLFTREDIDKFLIDAPDEIYLMIKVFNKYK